jgi:AraC-like DNA-binding protein
VIVMRVLQAYKSKKYLLRIMLSITLLMVMILSLSSGVLHYSAEKRVLHMQQEANRKVMNQINHNMAYMQEIVKNLALRLYTGTEIVPLMTDVRPDPFDTINAISLLGKEQDSSVFLHSILVYNGHLDEIHAVGELAPQKRDEELAVKLAAQLKGEEKLPQVRLIPMNLSGSEHGVDFFTMLVYENYYENSRNDSVLALNVRPEWIFDNLKAVNDFAAPDDSGLFMTDAAGRMIFTGGTSDVPAPELLREKLREQEQGDFGFFTTSLTGFGKYIVTYMNMGEGDLKVVSIQPYNAVLGDIVKMRTTSIVVIVCFLVVSLLVCVLLSHKLYKPVETMLMRIKKAHDSGDGLPGRSSDELSYVTDVHRELVHKLYDATNERDQQKKIVRNYYLRSIVTNSFAFPDEEFRVCIGQNGLHIEPGGPYTLVLMKVDNQNEYMTQTSPGQRELYFFAVTNIAEEIFVRGRYCCEIVDMRGDHLVAVISGAGAMPPLYGELKIYLKQIQDIVQNYYHLSLSMTVSEAVTDHRELTSRYDQALQLSMYKLLFGKRSIITPDMVQPNLAQLEYHAPLEQEKKLVEAIRTNDLEQMETCVSLVLRHLAGCQYDHIIHGVLHLVDIVKSTIREMNHVRVSTISIDLSGLSRTILEKETLAEMEEHLHGICQDLHDKLKHTEQDHNAALAQAVKEIIHTNYKDMNLSLQSIASTLKMTSAYVGRMFKQSEFVAVGEYINEIRLTHAQELLETKTLSIKEIMELVGFLNESTFFKLFKKKYGVTPKEYRLKRSMG